MLKDFLKHYESKGEIILSKLKEFEYVHEEGDWFEEMTFCVFAANSSAEMGLKAVELLRGSDGSLEDYKKRVGGKVRFYNKRSEYLHYNKELLKKFKDLKTVLKGIDDFYERRRFLVDNFKGFGFKEASHFLRNVGYKGYCIIDKHILRLMKELGVFETDKPPKNEKEYYEYERLMKKFVEENGLDVDVLDLALWSYATGKIIK